MAYYECLNNKKDHIYIGESFIVNLTGSHNTTITASVFYIGKSTVCLLADISLASANWHTQCNYRWNYSVNIKGKKYTGTCKIPTKEQISKCLVYKRDYYYWTSDGASSSQSTFVDTSRSPISAANIEVNLPTLPFIEITL